MTNYLICYDKLVFFSPWYNSYFFSVVQCLCLNFFLCGTLIFVMCSTETLIVGMRCDLERKDNGSNCKIGMYMLPCVRHEY